MSAPGNGAATARDGGDTGGGASATVGASRDRFVIETPNPSAAELQLVGCVLHCTSAPAVLEIGRAVPVEAIHDGLDRVIFAATLRLAERDEWDPANVAREVHAGGYPRDKSAPVTARVVEIMAGCVWPLEWRPHAAEVVEIHARQRVAVLLRSAQQALSDRTLDDLAVMLSDAVDMLASNAAVITALMRRGSL